MSTKEKVLAGLEEDRGNFISGEKLANLLNLSRTSIWKAITLLKEEGHLIESFPQKGYRLKLESDCLSTTGLRLFLNESIKDYDLKLLTTVDSTNQEAKRMLLEDGLRKVIILSEEQTKGRGRRGRDFFSPAMTGIYMSIVLKPDQTPKEALGITIAAAVGISRAIKKLTGIDVQIKWVNDIYLNNKKIAGILTEAGTNFETGMLDYLILGMGINVSVPEKKFPKELSETAGCLFSEKPKNLSRNQLAAEIINQVMTIFKDLKDQAIIEEYRKRSMVIGETIEILRPNKNAIAKVIGIDQAGGLMVEYKKGDCETLHFGEISIKRMEK